MSDTAAEIVNLCDDTPLRPTKRSRPERTETKVLSLVESDDDSPLSIPRPRDPAGQSAERHPRMLAHWGAMEEQGVSRPMPVYRPSSARSRRMALPSQPRANVDTSPIVVDDDEEDDNFLPRPTLVRHISGLVRQHAPGADGSGHGFARPPLPPSVLSDLRVAPGTSGVQMQRQQQQQQPLRDQEAVAESLQPAQYEAGAWRSMIMSGLPRPSRRPFRVPLHNDVQGNTSQPTSQQRLEQRQHTPLSEVGVGDQEDEDMRLAARLQAEEDEHLAQETAHRLDQEEHRRVMSRLDMLESLEGASIAEAARQDRERASRRADRFGVGMAAAGGGDLEFEHNILSWRALPRPTRGPASSSMPLFGGPGGGGGDTGRVAESAVLAAAAEEVAAAAAAVTAAGMGAGSRPRFSTRSLQDMLPAMMSLPFGLHRIMGGRGDLDENAGAHRRARHAAAAAYREQAMVMREQILAAHRAGIPAHLLLSDRDFTPEDYELLCRLDEQVENRKGAKDEQLTALPAEVVGADGRRRSDGCPATCTICMEDFAPGDVLKRLPCLHDFHGDCVDTWLKTKACCPICQRGLDPVS